MSPSKFRHNVYAATLSILVACGPPTNRPPHDEPAATTSPKPGPTMTQALADAVFEALARRDHAAFGSLFLPDELALASCQNVVDTIGKDGFLAHLAKDRAASEQAFAACAAEADWRDAANKNAPESSLHPTQKCSGLKTWRSIEPSAFINGRGFSFRLNQPVEVGGRVYLVGGFTCGEGLSPVFEMPEP